MHLELIKKYNVQGPRYTSYPTAVQFSEGTDREIEDLHNYLLERNSEPQCISLYFYIPFCFSLCWYCVCTKVITKDTDRGDAYPAYLEKEMDQKVDRIYPDSEVMQVHFGGDTPPHSHKDHERLFPRNIAMCFDCYLNASATAHNYSETV